MRVLTWLVVLVVASVAVGQEVAKDSAIKSSKAASQPSSAPAQEQSGRTAHKEDGWLDKADKTQVKSEPAPAAAKGPPLPFHTIEGYGGGAITPMAYLVNPGPKGAVFGAPAAAFSNVMMGSKNLQAFTVTETLLNRIELGYGLDRLGLGSLPGDIERATGVDIDRNEVYLQNFNVRGLLVEENSFGLPLPALTAGAHFKVNSGISDINQKLGGALTNIGYEKSNGVDFTLTASKTFVNKWTLNRPLIGSVGLRNSDAAQLGFLGFGGTRTTTVEANVAYLPTDWLLVAYEFRQKANPYDEIPGLVGDEDNWNAIDVSWIINSHATLVAGWGAFGNMANSEENGAWWLQFKYEF